MPIHSQFQNVTGSVALSEQPGVLLNSGSVTGLLVGGVPLSFANPLPISGSIAAIASGIQDVTGSNWIPTITGSVVVTNQVNVTGSNWTPTITGSVKLTEPITGSVTLASAPQVLNLDSQGTAQTAAWTNSTPVNTVLTFSTVGFTTVLVSLSASSTGSLAGAQIAPELSNDAGVTWFSASLTRVDTHSSSQLLTLTSLPPVIALKANIGGATNFRIRLAAVITDTGTANFRAQASALPSDVRHTVGQLDPTQLNATVTGSIVVANRVDVSGSAWTPTITGSVSVQNQVNVTGSSWTPTITGSVVVANRVDISGSAWTPTITGSVVVANIVNVTGSVGITAPVAVLQGTSPWIVSASAWIPTVTGSVVVTNRVDVTGSNWVPTVREISISASVTFISSSDTQSITFAVDNSARRGIILYNDSNRILYVKLGVSASLNDYSTQMAADDMYEVPFGYTGRIDAISSTIGPVLTGPVRVTELV